MTDFVLSHKSFHAEIPIEHPTNPIEHLSSRNFSNPQSVSDQSKSGPPIAPSVRKAESAAIFASFGQVPASKIKGVPKFSAAADHSPSKRLMRFRMMIGAKLAPPIRLLLKQTGSKKSPHHLVPLCNASGGSAWNNRRRSSGIQSNTANKQSIFHLNKNAKIRSIVKILLSNNNSIKLKKNLEIERLMRKINFTALKEKFSLFFKNIQNRRRYSQKWYKTPIYKK